MNNLFTNTDMGRSAKLSDCGKYRWRLDRDVQAEGKVFAYFGINASTADSDSDDQTSTKWTVFTRMHGGRKYIAANPFAYRATDVKELASVADPVGRDNLAHLRIIIAEADVLIPCWGSLSKIPKKLRPIVAYLENMLLSAGKPVLTFGLTKSGDPAHPLMLAYSTPLIDFNIARSEWRGKGGRA